MKQNSISTEFTTKDINELLNSIPLRLQTQESLDKQLNVLILVANRLGMYDAADFISAKFKGRV